MSDRSEMQGRSVSADLRVDYGRGRLDEADVLADPVAKFGRWFDKARAANVAEPNAMTLATVDPFGAPRRDRAAQVLRRARLRLLHQLRQPQGPRARRQPAGGVCFFWQPLERQVRVEGTVERVGRAESEEYFQGRPVGRRGSAPGSRSRAARSRRAPSSSESRPSFRSVRGRPCRSRTTGAASASSPIRSNSGRAAPAGCTTGSFTPAPRQRRPVPTTRVGPCGGSPREWYDVSLRFPGRHPMPLTRPPTTPLDHSRLAAPVGSSAHRSPKQAEELTYIAPAGWDRSEQERIVVFTPPKVPPSRCALIVTPGENLEGDFLKWFKTKWDAVARTAGWCRVASGPARRAPTAAASLPSGPRRSPGRGRGEAHRAVALCGEHRLGGALGAV